jgi:hypothetical protein
MVLGKLDIHMYRTETNSHLSSGTKINSKWITDLNERPEAVKLVEENTGKTLEDTGTGNDFLTMTP